MSDNFLTLPISDIIIKNRYRKDFGDIEGLTNNINEHTLLVPITVSYNQSTKKYSLVDGQRRILAFQQLNRNEIPSFVINLEEIVYGEFYANTHRKSFTPSEAVRIKKALTPLEQQKAKERQINANPFGKKLENNDPYAKLAEGGTTRDKVADYVGYKRTTLSKAEKLVDAADQNPKYQKYIDEMDSDDAKIGPIYRRFINDVKTEEQLNSTPSIPLPKGYDLHLGDFAEILKNIPDNSIDFIITDPLYEDTPENLLRYKKLADNVFRVLKPESAIVFITGHIILDKVIQIFDDSGLKFWHYITLKHNGHTQIIHARNLVADTKPILCYVKGEKINEMVMSGSPIHDFIESEPPPKHLHPWTQSNVESEYLIKKYTTENSVILDPLMGTGTNLVAAIKLNRKNIIGIDNDSSTFEKAKSNILHALNDLTQTK